MEIRLNCLMTHALFELLFELTVTEHLRVPVLPALSPNNDLAGVRHDEPRDQP